MERKTGTEQLRPAMFLLFYMHLLYAVSSSSCLHKHTGV